VGAYALMASLYAASALTLFLLSAPPAYFWRVFSLTRLVLPGSR